MCLWNKVCTEKSPQAARLQRRGAIQASMCGSLSGLWAIASTEQLHRQHWMIGTLLGVQIVLLVSAMVSLRLAHLARIGYIPKDEE